MNLLSIFIEIIESLWSSIVWKQCKENGMLSFRFILGLDFVCLRENVILVVMVHNELRSLPAVTE